MDNLIKDKLESEASFIRQYIAFDGTGKNDQSDQAKMQSMGVAALWHRIQEDDFAYLADEVGMGKTRQAMGVIATQFLKKPDSRVVIICPGRPLQDQWKSEWHSFVSGCLLINDGVLKSALNNNVNKPLALHNKLSEFASSLLLDEDRLHLLRYSSFSRPIGFNGKDSKDKIKTLYKNKLNEIGISDLNAQEKEKISSVNDAGDDWRKGLTAYLNTQYAKRIEILFNEDTRPIDLIVCDEAQYLRHTGNSRNTHLNLSLASKPNKWLFLSATPLHGGQSDIKCLDHYICTHKRDSTTHECISDSCINIRAKMKGTLKGGSKSDVVDILDEFLVRRPRQYRDSSSESYDKVSYRQYGVDAAVATNDAFSSMVTALVQKRLVQSLGGKNNRFRQGECSSFESLASSVKKVVQKNSDGIPYTKPEIEPSGHVADAGEVPPDRGDIDQLNKSLRDVLVDSKLANRSDADLKNIPHPKLYHVADQLVESCLKNSPNHKTLVFVRRLATVEELIALLKQRFQKLIDHRVNDWSSVIKDDQIQIGSKRSFSDANEFWSINELEEDPESVQSEQEEDEFSIKEPDLSYFKAIRKKSEKEEHNGMLYSFSTRLLQPTNKDKNRKNPLAFLIPNDDEQKEHLNSSLWNEFLAVIFDEDEQQPDWLMQHKNAEDVLMLKRCILQSMRRSDFLVDLYILNGLTNVDGRSTLSEKLIWIFKIAKGGQLVPISSDLHEYFNNWRKRLKRWCVHFELIRSKCFKSGITDIDAEFRGMGPVVGRSGSISNKYAVTQFKMPCFPNILICTDVLKEGVDMHLFCDEVIHYGVAWTSGDLEQRIGRVDRVNSLINRRISKHKEGRDSAPKLKAGFPFLAGTLDQYQVKRVVNEKLLSDLRMDFGKREDEIKDISIDDVFNNSSANKELPIAFKTREFIPTSLLLEGELLKNNKFSYRDCNVHKSLTQYESRIKYSIASQQLADISVRDIYPLPAVVIEYKSQKLQTSFSKTLGDNLKTKWEYRKVKGKNKWIESYEVVIPLTLSDEELNSVVQGFKNSGQVLEPTPVISMPEAKNFRFDKNLNTLAMTVTHEAPYRQTEDRKQTVILERMGNLLLMRSPIVTIEDLGLDDKELAMWIGKENNKRKLGYINDHEDVIWYCCLIAYPEKFESGFKKLVQSLSQTADRLQQLYTANDKEQWAYQANDSLNLILGSSLTTNSFKNRIRGDNDFRSDINSWHKGIFNQLIHVLSERIDSKETSISAVLRGIDKSERFLQKGYSNIRMPAKPALRFNLQSYLDVNVWKNNDFLNTEPMMVWELGVSAGANGRTPEIYMAEYDELPHMAIDTEWQKVKSPENTKIYTCQDEGASMRWIVLYHPAGLLDGRLELFLNAWAKVLVRLKENKSNFTRDKCAKDFDIFS